MANNKTTYVLEIDAELGQLEKKLGSIKGLMSGVLSSANAPKGFEKTFEKVEELIDRIKAKSSQPINSKAGFGSITKDIDSANVALTSMLKIVESIGSMSESAQISFLPPDAQEQINAVITSLSNYEKAMSAAIAETAELTAARVELAKAEEKVATAQAKVDTKTGQLEQAKAEKQTAEGAIAAIKERKAQLVALRAEQEKIEKFYATPDDEGKKRNQSKKYDGISMRPQDIKKKIADLEKASAGDESALEDWREQLKAAKSDIDSYIGQVQTARRELSASQAAYEQLTQKVNNLENVFETGSAEAQEKAFQDLRNSAERLGVSLDDIGDSYSEKDAKELITRLSNIKTRGLQQIPDAAEEASEGIRKLGEECNEVKGKVDSATESFEGITEAASQQKAFEDKIKSFLGLSGAAQVMRAALRDAMQTITELDATMTEMAVVTDLTVGDYWDQLPQYSKRASELGVSINSAYKAATLYYQQGLKTNEVNAISAETLKMAKIAGLDAADATNKMTAALRGFNMELNETSARKVSDVYSELAAITAADVGEISTAMTKTASIASSAGMEFETTAAFLSQIIETTRESAETAGTAMKTVIARFQELKKAPEDIGEVDGEIVDANAIETALRSVGVSLRDAGGQFRELDDVFLELSSKWDGLDKNTQRYIATIAAGSRQQSRFIAMMSNYNRTQELVTAANNSAGASNEQFEKTMESLEAKIERLKNAWHEFTMGIMNSNLVKTGVDILTKFLEVINKITQGLGDKGVGGGLTKIMSVLMVFKMGMKIFEKFRQPVIALFSEIVKQAGISGEKSGKAFQEGLQKGQAGKKSTGEGTPVANTASKAILTGQGTYEDKDGVTRSLSLGEKVMGTGAKAIGVDHFAQIATLQQEKKKAAVLTSSQNREELVQNQVSAQKNVEQQQEKKQEVQEVQRQAQIRKKAADENISRLQGKGLPKNTKEWKKAAKAQKEANKALQDANKALEDQETILRDATAAEEEASNGIKEYDKAVATISNSGKAQMKAFSDGCAAASGALLGVGMGLGMVGSAFESLGMEEAAEGFNKASQIFSTTGAVLGIIPPILSLIQALFPGVGAASAAAGGVATASGLAASSAWGIVGVIVLIVMAAIIATIAIILVVMALIKNASPEKKLEDAQNAAKAAGEAADEAAESYENLASALDELDDKYDKLENLTKGTKEWNEAIRDINTSVLDLIQNYPELAAFVENKEGVLTIDVNSQDVQAVLQEALNRKIIAQNEANLANVAVSHANNEVAYSNLDKDITKTMGKQSAVGRGFAAAGGAIGTGALTGAGIGGLVGASVPIFGPVLAGAGAIAGAVIGGVVGTIGSVFSGVAAKKAADENNEKVKNATDELAKALASGEIMPTQKDIADKLVGLGYASDEAKKMAIELEKEAEELREYGESLNAADAQQQSAYDAIATSAQTLANTLNMTAEQIQQSSVIADGDLAKKYYEEKKNELSGSNLKDLKDSEEAKRAIRQTYGETATIDKKGNVTYQKDGENKTVTLTEEQVKNMIANQYATSKVTSAVEYSDNAIAKVGEVIGADTANALYMANKGGALTQKDLQTLVASNNEETYNAIWENLSQEERDVYGNDINELKKDFTSAITSATDNFKTAGEAVRDFMTADMAIGFKNKLDEVAELAGGEEARTKIQTATDTLMLGKTDKEKQEIQNRINATDWSSLEGLKALQIDLMETYNISKDEAETYVSTVAQAAYATSSLTTTIEAFGGLYQANQKVESSLSKISELQWEYNRALAEGGDNLKELIAEQLLTYDELIAGYEQKFKESSADLEKIWGRGLDRSKYGYDLSGYLSINEDGSLDTSKGSTGLGIQDLYDVATVEQREAIEQFIEDYNSTWQSQQDSLEGLRTTLDDVKELEAEGKDAFYELRDMAKETILEALEKQLEVQEESLEAIQNANEQMISKIQEQIDETRQARANEEQEENLVDLQSQQAYLMMDTSGANSLEQQQLAKQIEEEEESYQDTLIDQALQNLSDANEKAAEQRERQIALAETQLEVYQTSAEFQQHVDSMLEEMISADSEWKETTLGEMMIEKFTEGMSGPEASEWQNQIVGKIGAADTWKTTDWGKTTEGIDTKLASLPEGISDAIVSGGEKKAINDQATSLSKLGFDMTAAGVESKDGIYSLSSGTSISSAKDNLSKMQAVVSKDSKYESSDTWKQLQTHKNQGYTGEILSQKDYYAQNSQGIVDGTAASYTDYLNAQLSTANQKQTSDFDQRLGMPIPMERDGWNDKENKLFNLKIIGYGDWDKKVETGAKLDSQGSGFLSNMMNQYANEGNGNKHLALANIGAGYRLYIRDNGSSNTWYPVLNQGANKDASDYPKGLTQNALNYVNANKKIKYKYKTGGIADFTGPAWLDGTPSKPEYILSAAQTERFFSLIDVLEDYDSDKKNKRAQGGDNYFDISINVEKIEDDYDVEQMVDKIRRMIYDDATYRNVNSINHIR